MMIKLKEFAIGSLYLLCCAIVQGSMTAGPRNVAIFAGDPLTMDCRVENRSKVFKWMLSRPFGYEKELIVRMWKEGFIQMSKFGHFSYEFDQYGSGYIYTNASKPSDAGLYFCYVDPGQMQYNAHLVVFEDEPLCETNYNPQNGTALSPGDSIWITCSINFTGWWPPTVEWRQHTVNNNNTIDSSKYSDDDSGGDGDEDVEWRVIENGVTTTTSFSKNIISTLTTVADFKKPTYFSFRIYFLWLENTITVNATNLPEFLFEWKSPEMIVEQTMKEFDGPKPPKYAEIVVKTVTEEPKSSNDWFVISLSLIIGFSLLVVLVVAIVIRRCYAGYRRINGLDNLPSPSAVAHLSGLERPPSGDYDDIPNVIPNIYECIDDNEVKEYAASADDSCNNFHHPPLTQCYSHLSDETTCAPSCYDVLTQYLDMSPTEKSAGFLPFGSSNGKDSNSLVGKNEEDRGRNNYITIVGENDEPHFGGTSRPYSVQKAFQNDLADYLQPDEVFKNNDDYMVPLP